MGGTTISIGQTAGSDNNCLVVAGTVAASQIDIGSIAGNTGNALQVTNTGSISAVTAIHLALANVLILQGDYSNIANLLAYLGSTSLQTYDGTTWVTITAVPEPPTNALFVAAGIGFLFFRSRQTASARRKG